MYISAGQRKISPAENNTRPVAGQAPTSLYKKSMSVYCPAIGLRARKV